VGFKTTCVLGCDGIKDCKDILRGEINFITSHFYNKLIIRCILKRKTLFKIFQNYEN